MWLPSFALPVAEKLPWTRSAAGDPPHGRLSAVPATLVLANSPLPEAASAEPGKNGSGFSERCIWLLHLVMVPLGQLQKAKGVYL